MESSGLYTGLDYGDATFIDKSISDCGEYKWLIKDVFRKIVIKCYNFIYFIFYVVLI